MEPSTQPQPEPLDLARQLPRDVYFQLIHTLCASLPPPVTDTPQDRAHRDNAAIARVAWTWHCAIGFMADALGRPAPAPIAEPSPPSPVPAPQPEPPPSPKPISTPSCIRTAVLIRKHGGVPPNCTFGPPEPDLAHAVATGTSEILRAVDNPAEAGEV